jgi:hypothetical protein
MNSLCYIFVFVLVDQVDRRSHVAWELWISLSKIVFDNWRSPCWNVENRGSSEGWTFLLKPQLYDYNLLLSHLRGVQF